MPPPDDDPLSILRQRAALADTPPSPRGASSAKASGLAAVPQTDDPLTILKQRAALATSPGAAGKQAKPPASPLNAGPIPATREPWLWSREPWGHGSLPSLRPFQQQPMLGIWAAQAVQQAVTRGLGGDTAAPTSSGWASAHASLTPRQVEQNVAATAAQPAYVKAEAARRANTNALLGRADPAFKSQVDAYLKTKFAPGDQTVGNQWVERVKNLRPQDRLEALDPKLSDPYKAAILRQAAIVAKDPKQALLRAVPPPAPPNALQKAVGAVGNVLATPAAAVKAVVEPIQARFTPAENVTMPGTNVSDYREQQRVARLPFAQRMRALQNQPITRMAQPNRAAQEAARYQNMNPAERLGTNLTNMAVNMATDPLTYAGGALFKGLGGAKAAASQEALSAIIPGAKQQAAATAARYGAGERALSGAFATSMLAPYAANPGAALAAIKADPAAHLPQLVMGALATLHAMKGESLKPPPPSSESANQPRGVETLRPPQPQNPTPPPKPKFRVTAATAENPAVEPATTAQKPTVRIPATLTPVPETTSEPTIAPTTTAAPTAAAPAFEPTHTLESRGESVPVRVLADDGTQPLVRVQRENGQELRVPRGDLKPVTTAPTPAESAPPKVGEIVPDAQGNPAIVAHVAADGETVLHTPQPDGGVKVSFVPPQGAQRQETGQPEPTPSSEIPANVTATRNTVTEAERAERGLSPVERQAYTTMGVALLDGKTAVESGTIDPERLARDVAATPRPLSATEVGALGHDRAMLAQRYNVTAQALDTAIRAGDKPAVTELQARLSDLSSRLDQNDQALVKGGREQSAAFAARQMFVADDGSLADVKLRAERQKGAPLTPQETARYAALTAKFASAQARVDALEQQVRDLQAKQPDQAGQAAPRQATNPRTREFGASNKLVTQERGLELKQTLAEQWQKALKETPTSRGSSGGGNPRAPRGMIDLAPGPGSPAHLAGAARRFVTQNLPALAEYGAYLLEGGARMAADHTGAWADAIRSAVPNISNADLQTVWTNARTHLTNRAGNVNKPTSALFVDRLAASMTRAGATKFVNALNEAHPGALDKLISGGALTPQEVDTVTRLHAENSPKRTPTAATGPIKTLQDLVAEARDTAAQAARAKAAAARTPAQVFRDDLADRIGGDRADAFVRDLPAAIKAKLLGGKPLTTAEIMQVAKLYDANRPPASTPSTPSAAIAAVQESVTAATRERTLSLRKAEFEAQRPAREAAQKQAAAAKEAAKTDADRLRDAVARSLGNDGADAFFKQANPDDVNALLAGNATPAQTQALGKLLTSLQKQPGAPAPVIKPVEDLRAAASDVRAQKETQQQIAALQEELRTGKPAAQPRTQQQVSAELQALKDQRDALASQVGAQRAEPRRLAAINAQIADLQQQLDSGNFKTPQPRTPKVLSDAVLKATEERNRLRQQIHDRIADQRPKTPADYLLRWQRLNLLSGISTLGKLGSAATGRIVTSPIEELIGAAVPGKLASKAPVEGKFVPAAEVAALRNLFTRDTLTDMVQKVKTGSNSLDALYATRGTLAGKGEHGYNPVLDFFGGLHGAIKTPAQRAAFGRAFEKIARSLPAGTDTTDPGVQMQIGTRAYLESKRAILMQDNVAMDIYKGIQQAAMRQGPIGKAVATGMRVVMPIVRVPTNYVGEIGHYVGGVPEGLGRIIAAKGIDGMTPEQADATMRAFKKGGVGLGLMALGYYGKVEGGGYYQQGKRNPNGLKPGEIRVGGVTLPHYLAHTPALEAIQWGATLRRVMASTQGTTSDKLGEAARVIGLGTAEQVPFVETPISLAKATQSTGALGKKVGQVAQTILEPQLGQQAAAYFDKDAQGKPIPRAPRGFREQMKMGVPKLRQQVPVKSSGGGGGGEPNLMGRSAAGAGVP